MEEQLLWLAAVLDFDFCPFLKTMVPICILLGVLLSLRFLSTTPGNFGTFIFQFQIMKHIFNDRNNMIFSFGKYVPYGQNMEGNSALNFFYKQTKVCVFLPDVYKSSLGKFFMQTIPYVFSGACIRHDNFLRKSYPVLIELEGNTLQTQILFWPCGHLSTCSWLWAILRCRHWWFLGLKWDVFS